MEMLKDVLLPELVQRLDPSPEPTQFIRNICEQLSPIVGLSATTLEQAFMARMRNGSVCTPEGVAFPHAVVAGIKRTVIGCILVPRGLLLDFTNPPADLIFVLVGDSSNPWQHVRLLARLSRIASDAEARARLKSAANGMALMELILQEDQRHA
ncbi:MAG: PTS sugar transporter subunit IIA [Planctomycetes bacterium]|nr:PTS sugar transporter subunit IIA [Planctomycetota bacterium]